MTDETQTGSKDGWNERAGELTLSKREILPASVAEFLGSMMTGDIRIETCVPGEDPSYKVEVIIGAKNEADARGKFKNLDSVIGVKLSDKSFSFDDKDDTGVVNVISGGGRSTINIGGNIMSGNVIMGGGRVIVNGVDMSNAKGEVMGSGVKKKEVVLRVSPDQSGNYNFSNQSGRIEIDKIKGKGKFKSASGNIVASEIDGNFGFNARSGNIKIETARGKVDAKTASGDVDISELIGSCAIDCASGDVSIEDALITQDSSANTASGDIDVRVSNKDAKIRMRTASGDLSLPKSGFTVDKDNRRSGKSGGSNASYINVSGSSVVVIGGGSSSGGYVEGHFGADTSAPELEIEAASGDITVKSTGRNLSGEEPKQEPPEDKSEFKCPYCHTVNPPIVDGNCGNCGGTLGGSKK